VSRTVSARAARAGHLVAQLHIIQFFPKQAHQEAREESGSIGASAHPSNCKVSGPLDAAASPVAHTNGRPPWRAQTAQSGRKARLRPRGFHAGWIERASRAPAARARRCDDLEDQAIAPRASKSAAQERHQTPAGLRTPASMSALPLELFDDPVV